MKVLIVGAGAAGLTAAYKLMKRGVEFTLLEAISQIGVRVRHNLNFADFPIALGGEWLHCQRR